MIIERFEDILAWRRAKELTVEIKAVFRNCRDSDYYKQIWRASISIMNNIAEGYERRTNKELVQFLYIAKGSCGEVRSMLSLAVTQSYLSQEEYSRLSTTAIEISKMLSGFIKKL